MNSLSSPCAVRHSRKDFAESSRRLQRGVSLFPGAAHGDKGAGGDRSWQARFLCTLRSDPLWTAASQAAVVLAASTLSSRLQSRPTSSRSQSLKVMGVQPWQ